MLAACDPRSSTPPVDAARPSDTAAHSSDDAEQASDDAEQASDAADASPETSDAGEALQAADASLHAGLDRDAATPADAMLPVDASRQADAHAPTWTPKPCDQTCTDTEVCIDGNCLRHCGADVDALHAALAPHLEVHFAQCDTGAFAQAVPRDTLYELFVRDGTFTVGYRGDTHGPLTSFLELTPTLPAGTTFTPSPFFAIAPNGPLLVGYTSSAAGGAGGAGGVLVVPKLSQRDAGVSELAAPGNRAAAIITTFSVMNTDPFFVIADGLGTAQEGPGVYRGRLDGSDPGLALRNTGLPQSIATRGSTDPYLLVGALPAQGASWPDGDGPRVFVIPVGELGGAPIDAFAHTKVARFSDFPAELAAGRSQDEVAFITRDPATHAIATLEVRTFTPTWSSLFSAPTRWVTGGSFTSFTRTGYSSVMLRHARGTWFVLAH